MPGTIYEPWYFEVNGMMRIPDNMLGAGSILQVVDTCIDFYNNPSLAGCHFPSKYDNSCKKYFAEYKNVSENKWKEYVHGTEMASIICSKKGTHVFHKNDPSKSHYEDSKNITEILVKGLAPSSKVQGIEYPIMPLRVKDAIKNAKEVKEFTSTGIPFFPEYKQSNMILVNLSGGEYNKLADHEGWQQLIIDACKDKYTLNMAASGNSGCNLNTKSDCKIHPAALKNPKICKESQAIISVGALNEYQTGEIPSLYHNSNYELEKN